MQNFFLIAGPCIIEDQNTCDTVANRVSDICNELGIEYTFKASFKKANRTSKDSFMGIEMIEALEILKQIGVKYKIPVLTDVHESFECEIAARYADILQIPAFLCRQTDLLMAAGRTGKVINIKKGQFLSPEAMKFAVDKVRSTGNKNIWVTERGSTFGYDSLVVDFTSVPRMKKIGIPVVVDCTHSVQRPNQLTGITGGDPEMIETICLAAVATGADGLFLEVHPDPSKAKSDAASMLQLDELYPILKKCVSVRKAL
jgi:2-dehydro-3-deoxyphosphooctonate aldolase (KDO 8-P synthase)